MRKYLSVLGWLLLIGCMTSIPAQQDKQCDKNCIASIKFLISDSKLAGGQPYFSSWSEKGAHRLGDRVAVGILKIYKKSELAKSKNIKIILPVIRESFLYPNLIENEADKVPDVSLSLLRDFESNVKNASLKEEITKSINLILEKTKKSSCH